MYTKLSALAGLVVAAAFVATGMASAGQAAGHQRNLPLVATSTLQHTLSVDTTGPFETGTGSVTSSPAGIDCPSTCAAAFDSGTSVTLTATADPGSDFTGWSGGGCSGTGTCQVILTADTAVDAMFENPAQPVLWVDANEPGRPPYNGTGLVTSSPAGIDCGPTCGAAFGGGTSVTLTATADSGSRFTGWSGGGCSGTGTCQVTLTADTVVGATFETTAAKDMTLPKVKGLKVKVNHKEHTAKVTFKGTDPGHGSSGLHFACKLDNENGGRFQSCRSGIVYEHLHSGHHTVQVWAIDKAGNARGGRGCGACLFSKTVMRKFKV